MSEENRSAALGYSLAVIKMFLKYGLITREEYVQIETVIERHYSKAMIKS
ncbi:hypothetical protein SAMN02910456_02527 [Ruminococcaceae bacterium YRB3002]|nr:hypothetical protein SAMN02910456_02527 [Ruminococcaceae bacterium YRB3002]